MISLKSCKVHTLAKLVKEVAGVSAKKLVADVFDNGGTKFVLSDSDEDDAKVIKAVKDGKYIKNERLKLGNMMQW